MGRRRSNTLRRRPPLADGNIRLLRCGSCSGMVETVHDVAQRRVPDLPIFDATRGCWCGVAGCGMLSVVGRSWSC